MCKCGQKHDKDITLKPKPTDPHATGYYETFSDKPHHTPGPWMSDTFLWCITILLACVLLVLITAIAYKLPLFQ